MDIEQQEEWRIVPSEPEIRASSLGRVWVAPCTRPMPGGGVREYRPRPTFGVEEKCATARAGSPKRRIIHVNRLKKNFKVHRLVCEAFHGPPPFPEAVVMHLDEDPSNNRPSNLRWGTRKENQRFPKVRRAFKARKGANSAWAIHFERKSADPNYASRSGKN